jgi:hypothetical protein
MSNNKYLILYSSACLPAYRSYNTFRQEQAEKLEEQLYKGELAG